MSESEEAIQKCTRCNKSKPISQFYQGHRNGKKFRYNVCAKCYVTKRSNQRTATRADMLVARGLHFLVPRRCGGCGKPIHWPSRSRGNLCITCSKPAADRKTYIDLYFETMGMTGAVSSCPGCAFVQVCQVRVKAGL
jgi:hypothetical protein